MRLVDIEAAGPRELSPREQARRHLLTLFSGGLLAGEFIEMRCLNCRRSPAGVGPRHYFRSVTDLVEAALELRERWDVFFGVGLRMCPNAKDIEKCPHTKRGNDHISRLPAAWVDLDVATAKQPNKPYRSISEALSALDSSAPGPTLAVASGGGVHAYWPLQVTAELERVKAINQALARRFKGDNAVDYSRVLRVAGTLNHKDAVPRPVRLLRYGNEPA